jgi:hypothetical protein
MVELTGAAGFGGALGLGDVAVLATGLVPAVGFGDGLARTDVVMGGKGALANAAAMGVGIGEAIGMFGSNR